MNNPKREMQHGYGVAMGNIIMQICAFLCLLFLLAGCRGTREVAREVPVYLHDTVEGIYVQKDSIFVHDSVYVYKNGDSVYISKWRTRYVERLMHDTIREVQEVPIEVVRTETVEVERPLTWWQQTKQRGFWWLLAVVGVGILWRTQRWRGRIGA